MLTCGVKLCTGHTNIAKPVQSYIRSVYKSNGNTHEAEKYAMEKHRQRAQFVGGLKELDKKVTNIDALLKEGTSYYQYLRGLTTRFRVSTSQAGWGYSLNPFAQKSIYLQFSWSDAYQEGVKFQSFDPQHEKASLLYILAHLQSVKARRAHAAASKAREDEAKSTEEIKTALHAFQSAAGILEFAAEIVGKINTPKSPDINVKLLSMQAETMVAQAQECVFEACLAKKVKAESLAALAKGCAEKYTKAKEFSDCYHSTQWLARTKYPWKLHLRHKILCWEATALYHQSAALNKAEKHGPEIAALMAAKANVQAARALEKEMRRGSWGTRLKFVELGALEKSSLILEKTIVKRLDLAEKENEAIYHERVPSLKKMEKIEANLLAKPSAFAEPPLNTESPLALLVPAAIQEVALRFRQELKEDYKMRRRDAETKAEEIRTALQLLNLPAALDAREGTQGIPDQLWARIQEIQAKGGSGHVDTLLKQVLTAQDKAWEIYNATKGTLDNELQEDEKLRSAYGGRWTRAPSKEITADFLSQLTTVEGYLKRAASADEKLGIKRKKEDASMQMLKGSRADIEANVPKVKTPSEKKDESPEEKTLKEDLEQLNKIIAARPKIIDLAEEKSNEWELEVAFLEDDRKRVDSEETKIRLNSSLDIYFTKLKQIDDRQLELLQQVEKKNEAWKKSLESDPQMAKRSEYFGKLNSGVEATESITNNLLQGLKFYGDCMAEYLNPLHQKVKDFVVAREYEKKMHMDQITRALAAVGQAKPMLPGNNNNNSNNNASSHASAPPPQGGFYGYNSSFQPTQQQQQQQQHQQMFQHQQHYQQQPFSAQFTPQNFNGGGAAPVHVQAQPFYYHTQGGGGGGGGGAAPMQVEATPVSGQHAGGHNNANPGDRI